MRNFVLLIFFVCLMAGCSGIPKNITASTVSQPQGIVVMESKEYPLVINQFKWKEGNSETKKLGGPSVYELAETFETIEAEKGAILKLQLEKNPYSIEIKQEDEKGSISEVQLTENEITLPLEKGYFIYEITAEWNEGTVSYIFDVNVN